MYAYGTGIFSLASSFVDLYVKKLRTYYVIRVMRIKDKGGIDKFK
jgi:hypothetical protein